MTLPKEDVATQPLTLTQELILMLLNEESGYFHQVPGWDLNCAIAGAVLAELSLLARIDTDQEALFLVDRTETGNPVLDSILKAIATDPIQRNAQYWIERLTPRAESVIDLTLDRLVALKVLEHHDGEFWTLSYTAWQAGLFSDSPEDTRFSSSKPESAMRSSTTRFQTREMSSLSASSTRAMSFASCFNLMTKQRSAFGSSARWI